MSSDDDQQETPAIEKIGVIGAGQMGGGIIQVLALAGYDVVLVDINEEQIGQAAVFEHLAHDALDGTLAARLQ